MFYRIKERIEELKKRKWFRPVAVIIVMAAIAIAVNTANYSNIKASDNAEKYTASEKEENGEDTKFEIGIGHIVMLIVFLGVYGIDKIIVYRNNLEDDKKYSSVHKEDD